MIHCETLVGTVSAAAANAAGTFVTRPITGRIIEIRQPGTQWGSTADYTFTRKLDGGTILAGVDYAGPWSNRPAGLLNNGTAAAGTASQAGIPVHGEVQLIVGSAVASAVGTVHIYYDA